MSRWRNNGGWNKNHGTVEKTPRIDSYEARAVRGRGWLLGYTDKGIPLVLMCDHYTEYGPEKDREIVEGWHPEEGWSQPLELSRKENGFGGSQAFFLCPACGERRRYLYQVGATFLCRKCSRLNYKSQQETKNGKRDFRRGVEYAEKHLDFPAHGRFSGMDFMYYVPDKPSCMHWSTYRQHLRKFLKYRDRYIERSLKDLRRIMGRN